MIKSLFIGDSLMNPRYAIGLIPDDTYIFKLDMLWEQRFGAAYSRTLILPGTRLKDIFKHFSTYFLPNECGATVDASIINLGIVDCAPRVMPSFMYFVVYRLPKFLQRIIQSFIHRNRPRLQKMGLFFRHTSPSDFKKYYSLMVDALAKQSRRVYVIAISPGKDEVYRRSPGLKESIALYNGIIKKACSLHGNVTYIDVVEDFQINQELYLTDDLHITKRGHEYIYEKIKEREIKWVLL